MKIRLFRRFAGIFAATILLSSCTSCAAKSPLQMVQLTHDSLAAAQDIEAQICWGVPNVAAGPADRTKCTTVQAAAVGLTDERHRELNRQFEKAFILHRDTTALIAGGHKDVDLTALSAVVLDILAMVGKLEPTIDVSRMKASVEAGRIK